MTNTLLSTLTIFSKCLDILEQRFAHIWIFFWFLKDLVVNNQTEYFEGGIKKASPKKSSSQIKENLYQIKAKTSLSSPYIWDLSYYYYKYRYPYLTYLLPTFENCCPNFVFGKKYVELSKICTSIYHFFSAWKCVYLELIAFLYKR